MTATVLPAPLFRFPRWLGVTVWIAAAMLSTLGRLVDARIRGLPVPLLDLLWTFGVSWLILAAWSPLAIRLARGSGPEGVAGRVSFDPAGLRRLAVAVAVFHVGAQATTALLEVLVVAPALGIPEPSLPLVFAGLLSRRLVITLLVMGAIVGFDLVQQVVRAERERRGEATRLGRALREARLAELRAELRPHFVFNMLNAISGAISHNPREADRMIAHFGDLLRATYEMPASEHALRDELLLAESYFAIKRTLYPELLAEPEFAVDPSLLDEPVPAMLLQPILENAIRHGVLPSGRPGRVVVRARVEAGRLLLEVENDGRSCAAPSHEGVGLRNTRERLTLLHGPEGRLDLAVAPTGATRVTLSWPSGRPAALAVPA